MQREQFKEKALNDLLFSELRSINGFWLFPFYICLYFSAFPAFSAAKIPKPINSSQFQVFFENLKNLLDNYIDECQYI
jgi:hypothetical protein